MYKQVPKIIVQACTFTFPQPIFHFNPYMGQSEKYAETPKNINIYETTEVLSSFYAVNSSQSFCKNKSTRYLFET
jgi:hypothetical protein